MSLSDILTSTQISFGVGLIVVLLFLIFLSVSKPQNKTKSR